MKYLSFNKNYYTIPNQPILLAIICIHRSAKDHIYQLITFNILYSGKSTETFAVVNILLYKTDLHKSWNA